MEIKLPPPDAGNVAPPEKSTAGRRTAGGPGTARAAHSPANHPQLTADELRQVKWFLGGVLTLVSVWTVFYMDVDAWILMGLTTVAVIAVLVRPSWPARIPRWVHRLAFPLIVAIFAGDLWLTGEALPAMVRLDILLLLYRGITYRQKRDDLQVIVLGLFLIVVAGVLTVSLTFAVQLLAFTACALVFLLVITLAEAAGENSQGGAAKPEDIASDRVPPWARHVHWRNLVSRMRQATDWRVIALNSGLFVGLVGVSALLFLAIPRFQLENSVFLDRFITKKAKTGFTDNIRFGDVTDLQQDNSVALSVDVSDRAHIPASPYWRMLVLDQYRDGTFRLSSGLQREAFGRERSGTTVIGRARGRPDAAEFTFYLESGISRYLPLLGGFGRLQFREAQNFRTGSELAIVALRNEPVTMTAYRVEGMDLASTLPDADFATRLRANAGNARAQERLLLRVGLDEPDRATLERIVREFAGEAKLTTGEFAQRAGDWLARHHGYSLHAQIPAGTGDPLVRWLTSKQGGHCELFAGSLALLARTAGIPARIVTGFKGGSWNGYSNNFTLRNTDAHAWCELFDEEHGWWQRADPTPGATVTAGSDSQAAGAAVRRPDRSWRARLESLRVFWYRRIVNFDQQSQMETLRSVKDATENSGRRLRAGLNRLAEVLQGWMAGPWDVRRGMKSVAILALAAALAWLIRAARSPVFVFRLRGRGARADAIRAEAGRWLARLKDVRTTNSENARVRSELERLRYGCRETWGEPAAIFSRARKECRDAKRRRTEPSRGR